MGNSSSSTTVENALEEFYSHAIGKHIKVGGSTTGGYSALEEYGNSVYSSAKESLIRGIAKDVSSMLKISATFAETADIKDVVSKLKQIVPNPKNKKSIKSDSHMHKELCMKLADSINKRYDVAVIDKSADPATVCNNVSEILYSLFTGLHSEFISISSDVSRIVKNLQILQEFVDSANKKLMSSLERSENGVDADSGSIKKLYDALTTEINRQQTILANVTGAVIGPTGSSLIALLEDNDDFKGLTADIKKLTGTAEFGNKLGLLLNSSASIAHAAEIVDKALKEIGMSVSEYKSVADIRDLREKVYNSITAKNPSSDELYKLLAAADVLYKNDMQHNDIVSYIESKKGGVAGGARSYDMSFADAADIATYVEKNDNPFSGRLESYRKSISRQIDQKEYLRKQLFTTFNDQIKHKYEKLKFSLSVIGKKIGTEVPLSQELDMFVRQLSNFSDSQPERSNIHIALSGYRTDSTSEYVKHQYVENLYGISEAVDALVSAKHGALFKDIKDTVDSLINLIMDFNQTFTKALSSVSISKLGAAEGGDCGCGGAEESEESGEAAESNVLDEEHLEVDEKSGGGAFESALGRTVVLIPESSFNQYVTIKKSIREIDYYYRIASVKSNITKASASYGENVENYENILGEEAGYLIDKIQNKYNALISALDTSSTTPYDDKLYSHAYTVDDLSVGLKSSLGNDIVAAKSALAGDNIEEQKKQLDNYVDGYKFLLEYIRSSKIEMLEASQALDLYLSKFTKSMQLKPDQVKEFVMILEQIEIIANFFNTKSGDHLVGVFEAFTNGAVDPPTIIIPDLAGLQSRHNADIGNRLDGTHRLVETDIVGDRLAPGKFYAARMMTRDQAVNFVKQIEKSVKGVRALENIIATFSKVNVNVSEDIKTFMSAGYMFKAFMKYTIGSAISVGYLLKSDETTVDSTFLLAGAPADGIHAKMAVSLRSNKKIYNIEFCDPLSIKKKADSGDICEDIFTMSIKSIVSKIFVIVGSYSLFNKPAKEGLNSLALPSNPLRQILGGSSSGGSMAVIIPNATELYLRLPLLVEWYRTVFEFKETDASNKQTNPLISIIPDMDSIWGDLCRIVFLDAKNIDDGAYPSDQANRIIKSVNDIYTHYTSKKPDFTCKDILQEFVLDINRRYGFIMRDEIKSYLDERYSYIDTNAEYNDGNVADYDLLDVEMQIGRRPAPSDKFRSFSKKESKRRFEIQDLLKVAKRFRRSIESSLTLTGNLGAATDDSFRKNADVSLSGIVYETTKKINGAVSPSEQYKIVHEQLHGVDKLGDVDQNRMILFHETVITPLTVLHFVYKILDDFNKFFTSLNTDGGDYPIDEAAVIAFRDKNLTNFLGSNNKYRTGASVMLSDVDMVAEFGVAAGAASPEAKNDLMRKLLNKVMEVGCDLNGLTEVNFVGSDGQRYPYLTYDALEEHCSKLFNSAKASFHQLRKFLPYAIVKQYESNEDENRLSLFHIQEQLFERLFGNKYGNGLTDANVGLKNLWKTLNGGDESYSQAFSTLCFWNVDTPIATTLRAVNANSNNFPIAYIPVFKSGDSINNPKTAEQSTVSSAAFSGTILLTAPPLLKENIFVPTNVVPAPVPAAGVVPVPAADATFGPMHNGVDLIYNLDDFTISVNHDILGFIPKLNALVYKYCTLFIDSSTRKIYKPLLEKFIHGHNAKDIMNAKNINDNLHDGPVAFNSDLFKSEPKEGAVLFASIANGLLGIMNQYADRVSGATSLYMEDSFLKINEYQKELMRAHLPSFEKELDLLIKKAEFVQKCLPAVANLEVVAAPANPNGATNIDITNYSQANKVRGDESTVERKTYLSGICDDVIQSSKSLIRCINDVQKELNDVPMYFETYSESIVDYNSRNGSLPLMPVSHITHLMNFANFENDVAAVAAAAGAAAVPAYTEYKLALVPNSKYGVGSSEFKFTYGTRGLLSYKQKPSLEFAPGVEALLTNYNSKVSASAGFDKKVLADVTHGTVLLSRYVVDFMYHKQVIGSHDWAAVAALAPGDFTGLSCQTNLHPAMPPALPAPAPAPPVKTTIYEVVSYTESDNINQSRRKLVECITNNNVANKLSSSSRPNFRIYNILDLNIVPINIHAMQREVAFVNILNYSYTFDHIVKNYLGVDFKHSLLETVDDDAAIVGGVVGADGTTKPEDVLVYQLIKPQFPVVRDVFINQTSALMNASNALKTLPLTKPKYLSDQLWNKVLLHGSKTHTANPDEGLLRYNTKLVRYLEWFTHIQRVTRLLMRNQLDWVQDPVVQGSIALSPDVTEYKQDRTLDLADYA